MTVSLATNHDGKIAVSQGRGSKVCLRIFLGVFFMVPLMALFCSFPRRSTPTVHAYSNSRSQSGAALFHEKGCEHCHGVDGRGGELGPSLSAVGKRLSKAQIEHQIHDGGAAMPAFGDVLQPDEIKDLVEYLHSKRKAPKGTAAKVQPATP